MAWISASATIGDVIEPGMNRSQPRLTLRETSAPLGTKRVHSAASKAARTARGTSPRTASTATIDFMLTSSSVRPPALGLGGRSRGVLEDRRAVQARAVQPVGDGRAHDAEAVDHAALEADRG